MLTKKARIDSNAINKVSQIESASFFGEVGETSSYSVIAADVAAATAAVAGAVLLWSTLRCAVVNIAMESCVLIG